MATCRILKSRMNQKSRDAFREPARTRRLASARRQVRCVRGPARPLQHYCIDALPRRLRRRDQPRAPAAWEPASDPLMGLLPSRYALNAVSRRLAGINSMICT